MATVELLLQSERPFFSRVFNLDGTDYEVTFEWSAVAEFWFMSLSPLDSDESLSGVKVVVGVPLLRQFADRSTIPAGDIVFVDPSGGGDPGRNDLGNRVSAMYVEAGT